MALLKFYYSAVILVCFAGHAYSQPYAGKLTDPMGIAIRDALASCKINLDQVLNLLPRRLRTLQINGAPTSHVRKLSEFNFNDRFFHGTSEKAALEIIDKKVVHLGSGLDGIFAGFWLSRTFEHAHSYATDFGRVNGKVLEVRLDPSCWMINLSRISKQSSIQAQRWFRDNVSFDQLNQMFPALKQNIGEGLHYMDPQQVDPPLPALIVPLLEQVFADLLGAGLIFQSAEYGAKKILEYVVTDPACIKTISLVN